jgi:flagellar export protein FliJ
MARFTFRLEPLLEQRRQRERDRQRRVAEIQRQVNALLAKVNDAQQKIAAENQTLSGEHLVGRLSLSYIAHEKRYVGSLQLLIMQALQTLALTQRSMEEARAALLEAAKARKALEKLRERQRARWRAEEERQEAGALDEIGMQLVIRRMFDPDDAANAAAGAAGAEDTQ